jgi:hypothetical protein
MSDGPARNIPNRSLLMPERRLMLAVLHAATDAFERYASAIDRSGRREFRDAESWFGADDWEWPFSFRNICDELGIDGERLRATLWRWRAALLDSETGEDGAWSEFLHDLHWPSPAPTVA